MNAKMGLGLLLGLFLIAIGRFQSVHASAFIEIRFQNYSSESKEDYGRSYQDPYFQYCLDRPRDPSSITPCYYGTVGPSDYSQDSDFINFDGVSNMKRIANPWIVHTKTIADLTILFVAKIRDDDTFLDDDLVTMGVTLDGPFYANQATASWNDVMLSQDGFTINFQYRVYCEDGYIGAICTEKSI